MTAALNGRATDALGTVDGFSSLEVQDRDPDIGMSCAVHPDHLDVAIDAIDGLCAGFSVVFEAMGDDGPVRGQRQRRPNSVSTNDLPSTSQAATTETATTRLNTVDRNRAVPRSDLMVPGCIAATLVCEPTRGQQLSGPIS